MGKEKPEICRSKMEVQTHLFLLSFPYTGKQTWQSHRGTVTSNTKEQKQKDHTVPGGIFKLLYSLYSGIAFLDFRLD